MRRSGTPGAAWGRVPCRPCSTCCAGRRLRSVPLAPIKRACLTVAIDGTCLDVPDSPLHRARLGSITNQYGTSGYPQICLTALVACGTRAVLDAAFGPRSSGETAYGKRLTRSLHAGMIVLLDRGFSGNPFLTAVASTEAAFWARISAARNPPVLAHFDDGSRLSRFGGLEVRIIECEITVITSQGRTRGLYRPATSGRGSG
ncbi:transposase [Streptomyces sp. DT24]|uniref:transposase n=1 Tax=unclassified Streptomyces TaxID=2593676 RepID=UPI003CF71EFE